MRFKTFSLNLGLLLSAILVIGGCGKKSKDDNNGGSPAPKSDAPPNEEPKNEGNLVPETAPEKPLAGTWAGAREAAVVSDGNGRMTESGSELRVIFNEGMVQFEKTCFGGGRRSTAQALGTFSATKAELTYIEDKSGQAPEGEYPCEVKISKGVVKYKIDGDKLTIMGASIYGTEFKRVKEGDKARETAKEEAKLAGTWTHGRILDWDTSGLVLKTDIETRWTFSPGAIRQVVECNIGGKTSVLSIEVKAIVWHGVIEILEGKTVVSPVTTCYLSVTKGEKIPYVLEGETLSLRAGSGSSDFLTRVSPEVLSAESSLLGSWKEIDEPKDPSLQRGSWTFTRTGLSSNQLCVGNLMRLDVQMIVRPGEIEVLESKVSPDSNNTCLWSLTRGQILPYTLNNGTLILKPLDGKANKFSKNAQ